jgi:hypothetical protein
MPDQPPCEEPMDHVRDTGDQVHDSADALSYSSQAFYDSAAQGGFALSGEGGTPLLVTIAEFKLWMARQSHRLDRITQKPPLGQLEGGKTVAPFMVEVATDASGFATRFTQLRESLTKAEEAIKLAIDNYQRLEAEQRIKFLRTQQAGEAHVSQRGSQRPG